MSEIVACLSENIIVQQFMGHDVEIFLTKDELLFKPDQIQEILGISNILEIVKDSPLNEFQLFKIMHKSTKPWLEDFHDFIANIIKRVRITGLQNEYQEKLELIERERQLAAELQIYKSKKYEEIKKTGCNYTLQTDSINYYKNGMSKHSDSKTRVNSHQTSNEQEIKVLHEFKTSCPKLLETSIQYALEMYRSNSGREYFGCKLDHIKNIVEIIGHVLDTCRSSFDNISRVELIQKILEKLDFASDPEELNVVNVPHQETDQVAQWVNDNIIYEVGSFLTLGELHNRYWSNPRVSTKEKGNFKSNVTRILHKFCHIEPEFDTRGIKEKSSTDRSKGWKNIRLI